MVILTILSLILVSPVFSQTSLSGNIGGMTLEQAGNPYLVTETITIQNGKTTTIKPGCIFLFKPFTGIDVHGTLVVSGVRDTPVVFTSINDLNYNKATVQAPNPFDWNGITIGSNAKKVLFSNFMLAYSVFGIKTIQKKIALENGIFLQNGQFNLTINGVIQDVKDNIPFSYVADAAERKPGRPLKVVALCTGITGMATAAGATVFYRRAVTANREGNTATIPADIADARSRESTAVIRAGVLYGTAAVLISAAVVMYAIDNKRNAKRERLTVMPDITIGKAGVCVLLIF